MDTSNTTNELGAETAPGTQRAPARPVVERPRLREGGKAERLTTWMELFFDLVFVAVVDQVARPLGEEAITGTVVFEYAAVLMPVWWAWVGYVFYVNRFGTDDLSDRLLTLAQMGAALALGVTVPRALESEGSTTFALAYAAFRLLVATRYAVAAWLVPEARPLASRFAAGFGLAALLWLASIAVPAPARFALWGAGLLIDVGTPLRYRRFNQRFPLNSGHLQERFGNFTLIVLGEGAIGVVDGANDVVWGSGALASAGLALAAGFMLWWVYFETSDGAPIEAVGREGRAGVYNAWLYAHLPLAAGFAAMGIGVAPLLRAAAAPALPDAVRWLFTGAVTLCLAALAVVNRAYAAAGNTAESPRLARWSAIAAVAVLAVGAAGDGLPGAAVAGLVAMSATFPVAVDLRHNARRRRPSSGRSA